MKHPGFFDTAPKSSEAKRRRYPFTHWLVLLSVLVVIGSCCMFGLVMVAYDALREVEIDPVFMLGSILPMALLMLLILRPVSRRISLSIDDLANAMASVAKGDYSVRLDAKSVSMPTAGMYGDFNIMASQLESVTILHESFVADFSHEFKTPINSLNGFANLLLEAENTPEERHLYLGIIEKESARLANLASNTLLLSRLDSQAITEDSQIFRLDEQVRESTLLLQTDWTKKGLTLNVRLDKATVNGNQDMLKEIWINLIGNAIKFTPQGGRLGIRLVCDKESKLARFSVADSGIGMTPEECAHVFDRYYQADQSHATQGCGLGLSIVQRIVELSNGAVRVESELHVGSTFFVDLPLVAQ